MNAIYYQTIDERTHAEHFDDVTGRDILEHAAAIEASDCEIIQMIVITDDGKSHWNWKRP